MGVEKQFICPNCSYEVMVSGGRDAGMEIITQTVVCLDCEELIDLVVARIDSKSGFFFDVEEEDDKESFPPCKHCSGTNVEPWEEPGLCPKCGTPMEEGPIQAMWD